MVVGFLMALSLVTSVVIEPVTLVEAKLQCRVDNTDEDALITALVKAARESVEAFTHRAVAPQTWDLKLDGFPCGDVIELPKPPVTAVPSISYVDTNGATQTWSASEYTTDLPTGPLASKARITPAYGYSWPSTRDVVNAVTVRFVCGYTTAPESIKAAIKILAAHWYANREPVVVGTIAAELPFGLQQLLWPYKAF